MKLEHCSLERLRRRLEEVDLQERLEVQVRDLLAILDAEELAELGVRDDAALEAGVKARVLLDVRRDELRDIRLALLRLGRQTHKRGELIGDRAELQERVVGAASLPSRALLGGHIRRVLLDALLGVAGITLERLDGLTSLSN